MPLNPKRQAKLGELERGLLVELEPIGSSPHEKSMISMVERHLVGLFGALKQVDAHLEERVVRAIRRYLDDYEQEKEHEKQKQRRRVETADNKFSERTKKGATKGKE